MFFYNKMNKIQLFALLNYTKKGLYMVKVVRGIKEAKEEILNIRKRQLESLNEQTFFTTVTKIINNVKDLGDQALINYTKDLDNVTLENILIPQKVLKDSWDNIDQKLKNSLMLASKRIREYHKISKNF